MGKGKRKVHFGGKLPPVRRTVHCMKTVPDDHYIVHLLKAAGTGRQRSMLPPLQGAVREPTFTCTPLLTRERTFFTKGGNSPAASRSRASYTNHPITEDHDYHWNLQPPRTHSDALDYRIVKHLRRKLNKRMEKRIVRLMDEEMSMSHELLNVPDKDKDTSPGRDSIRTPGDLSQGEHSPRDLLNTPSKTDRHSRKSRSPGLHGSRFCLTPSDIRPELLSRENGQMKSVKAADGELGKKTLLPDIKQSKERTVQSPNISVKVTIETGKVENQQSVNREASVFNLTGVKEKSLVQQNGIQNHQQLQEIAESENPEGTGDGETSDPIPEEESVNIELKVMPRSHQIGATLHGNISVKCMGEAKVISIYVQSCATDMEVERGALISKAYPRLRAFSLAWGYDLHMVEPHWGSRDLVSDDHSLPQLMLDLIDKTVEEGGKRLNFVTLLGQKYGDLCLPTAIPVSEFEAILEAMKEDTEKEIILIKARAEAYDAEQSTVETPSILKLISEKQKADDATKGKSSSEEDEDKDECDVDTPLPPIQENKRKSVAVEPRAGSRGSVILSMVRPQLSSRENTSNNPRQERKPSMVMEKLKRNASLLGKSNLFSRDKENKDLDDEVADPGLLGSWYILDRNCVPPMYRLQKISTHYKEILRTDPSKRSQARNSWLQTARRLQRQLAVYGKRAGLAPEVLKKYSMSLSEMELNHGVFSPADDANSHCYWLQREIDELETGLGDPTIKDYLDVVPMTQNMDEELVQALRVLREGRLGKKLSFRNIRKYNMPWHAGGISPKSNRSHLVYVDRVSRDFTDLVMRRLEQVFKGQKEEEDLLEMMTHEETSSLIREVEQHVNFCQKRSSEVHGRKDVLSTIKEYVRSDSPLPLVLHGKSGCGKTSVMAMAAMQAHRWLKRPGNVATVVRMVGVTGDSCNVRLLLRSLCLQLCHTFNTDPQEVPYDFKGLFNNLNFRLSMASEETPLIIFLDSLHRLSNESDARKLAWLPRELPPHVRLIVSTLSEDKYECLKHLKKIFSAKRQEVFVEVANLPIEEASTILKNWYQQAGRTVTPDQHQVLMNAFNSCPQPLYLRVIFNESLHWPSSFDATNVKLGSAVKNVATVTLGRLEKDYGDAFVRRALGYITASKNGVTRNELEDLVSLDDIAMEEVCTQNRISLRRLPPVMLLRLLHDVEEYIEETRADNCITLKWRNSQISEAAIERYMNNRDKAPSYHKALAEYFLDLWSGRPKPFMGSERGVDRYVTPQPLFREKVDLEGNNFGKMYNLRKLNELPYHLLKSQQMDVLKKECLCNFEFVLAKISATTLRAVVEDLHSALSAEPGDADLKLLSDTLHLSSGALLKDPRQLPSQVVGRLQNIITKDKPVAPGDPVVYPAMKPFYTQAVKSSIPALLPSITCLTPPGGVLFDLLSGHTDTITAVVISTDGQKAVTTAKDNTLKVWELRTGRVSKTIVGVGTNVLHIRLGVNNTLAITSETNLLRIWSLKTGECVKEIEGDDPGTVTTACDGATLVIFYHGCSRMKCWDLDGDFKLTADVDFEKENPDEPTTGIHKDNTTVVAHNSMGSSILHAFKDSSYAMVRNVKDGHLVHKLQCKVSGSVRALAVSREYCICAVRYSYQQLHEMHQLEVFNSQTGAVHRIIQGCTTDNFSEMFVNQIGSHVIAVCYSEAIHSSTIASWNIETEEHKHLAKHAKVSKFGACVDLRYVLTASEEESTLQIWNLSAKINQPMPREKIKDGVEAIIPMVDYSRYVITKCFNNGSISVWNIAKGKYSGSSVRVERGLMEPSDIILFRNTKAVILAEKGFSNVSEDEQLVFQTIIVYDMVTRKYIQKLNGCYVFPSPVHEYVILDDEHLMGLSENRNHLVVWSLVTGHIVYRIKSNFRTMDVKRTGMGEKEKEKEKATVRKRSTTAELTPWQRRSETKSARTRRHQREIEEEKAHIEAMKREKENVIEQYILSKDYSTIVASYYAHHMCVFDVPAQTHTQTLENPHSMLFLYVSALTSNGSHLVHTNYDDGTKTSYVTLWDCKTGLVKKRLRNEKNVQAIAVSDGASRVVFGKVNQELRIWEPNKPNSLRKIKGYSTLNFGVGSVIHIVDDSRKAIVFAGDISMWDLESGTVLAVFTPDMRIQTLTVTMDGNLVVFGQKDSDELVTLRLVAPDVKPIEKQGHNMFGEEESSDDDDEDEDEMEVNDDKQDGDEERSEVLSNGS